MNDKLKSILHTIWNEPRHFFFWLAVLGICGFVAAAAGAAVTHPTLLLSFVALGCALCFVVSIPAFILAWIPPLRRLFSWLLRRRFLVLGCLVTLVALFYAIEDWRGRRAWQNYKSAWEAKGERFDWAGLAPPPVPDDQNFFATPLWNDLHLHLVETNRSMAWSEEDRQERIVFSIYGPKGNDAPSPGNWIKAQRVALGAWQTFYRGTNNWFAAGDAAQQAAAQQAFRKRYGLEPASAPLRALPPSGPTTNYFPVAKEPQAPAADVLLALSKFSENRQILIAAAARPEARFWINYDAGFAVLLPHLARIKATAQYLSLHANAALKAGDRETALQDVKLIFRLTESIRSEATVLSHLVRVATLAIALQPVWEGLADRQWTEADLKIIESELGKLDFLADYHFAMRSERACNVWSTDFFRRAGSTEAFGDEIWKGEAWPNELLNLLGKAGFRLIPAGWFDQNKLSLCRLHEHYLQPLVGDREHPVISPAACQQARAVLEHQRRRPYDMLSKMLLPSLVGISEKSARGQVFADLARVACALERCRLANGQFPDTLDALVPKFIESLPRDVINGQPLKYRRTDDGQFILYSVGWNETDDGGTVGLNKYGNWDGKQGDWVWRYPAR
jgi:hypothetical protein